MGTGGERATLGAGVERVAVLVAGGHGRRTAPVALARAVLRDSTGRPLSTNIVVRVTPQAASRPQSSWGRGRGRRRSAPDSSPSALPWPGSQLLVLSTARPHLDVLTPMHAEASSACTVMGTGVGKATLGAGVERVAVLVAGGHGRRTAPVALAGAGRSGAEAAGHGARKKVGRRIKGGPSQYPEEAAALAFFRVPRT